MSSSSFFRCYFVRTEMWARKYSSNTQYNYFFYGLTYHIIINISPLKKKTTYMMQTHLLKKTRKLWVRGMNRKASYLKQMFSICHSQSDSNSINRWSSSWLTLLWEFIFIMYKVIWNFSFWPTYMKIQNLLHIHVVQKTYNIPKYAKKRGMSFIWIELKRFAVTVCDIDWTHPSLFLVLTYHCSVYSRRLIVVSAWTANHRNSLVWYLFLVYWTLRACCISKCFNFYNIFFCNFEFYEAYHIVLL